MMKIITKMKMKSIMKTTRKKKTMKTRKRKMMKSRKKTKRMRNRKKTRKMKNGGQGITKREIEERDIVIGKENEADNQRSIGRNSTKTKRKQGNLKNNRKNK